MINFAPASGSPRDSIGRLLTRPDLSVSAPAFSNDAAGGPRAANAAVQASMQLGPIANSGATFDGKVSLFFLAGLILAVMFFSYWTRGFQL